MAEADFISPATAEHDAPAVAWDAFDDAYHRVVTMLSAIECLAAAHIDVTTQEVADDPAYWAPIFLRQKSSIYSLAVLGQTLEKDLWAAAVAVRSSAKRG